MSALRSSRRAIWSAPIGAFIGLTVFAGALSAIDISVTGLWSLSIGAGGLTGGPGTDLTPSYESNTDQVTIDITNTTGNSDNWRVDVKRTDSTWHTDFEIWGRRTGAGTGGGSISGGDVYQMVETVDASFFSGAGDRSGIPIQLKLSGVSVQIPPDTYSTTVTYTVVDEA